MRVTDLEAENARLWAAWAKAKEQYDGGSTIEAFMVLHEAFDPDAPTEWEEVRGWQSDEIIRRIREG